MNEAAQAERDRRFARINALNDTQRRALLDYMCGYAPKGVDTMLDELEGSAACPDHRPVLDSEAGWHCAACGSDTPPI